MGKLNIAHHKSYHPYRKDNIERVRKDEEEARLKEAKEDGRLMLADSEARIDLLRQKAGITSAAGSSSGPDERKSKKRRREDEDAEDAKRIEGGSGLQYGAVLPTTNGHINLFEDLEHTQQAIAAAIRSSSKSKKANSEDTDKGVPLAPSAKDLNPWYSGKDESKPLEDKEEERRRRDDSRKSTHDPLTSITRQLAARSSSTSKYPTSRGSMRPPPVHPSSGSGSASTEVHARLTRESSERERALALIQRKRREMQGNMTPSTVADDAGSEYGDMYNRREVQEAHKYRGRDNLRDGEREREKDRGRYNGRRESVGGYNKRRWDDEDRDESRRSRSSSRW